MPIVVRSVSEINEALRSADLTGKAVYLDPLEAMGLRITGPLSSRVSCGSSVYISNSIGVTVYRPERAWYL